MKTLLLLAPIVVLAGCQDPDVGNPCSITWGSGSPPTPAELLASGGGDYFETGSLDCDDLVCIVSPAPAGSPYSSGGYCSKPCVSNGDCFESDTGLVCRQMVLDPVFIAQLSPEVRERYLADVQFSSYCAVAR
jgi:hypothetical protein